MNYIGKFARYTQPDTNYNWLMKVASDERMRCAGDLFKHRYLSGKSILIDDSKEGMLPTKPEDIELLSAYKTFTSNVRTKSVSVVNIERKELTSLFD
ncbi:MAG: hypothetical protein ACP5NW_02710 [Candidatus Woesearchaeota archaeon]